MKQSNFNFFVPISNIEKAVKKDKNGNDVEIMKVSGVASTMDEDTDGEVLDPNGFDCSYFLKSGFVNWHHQKDPEYFIGEPTKAEIKNNQLYVEAELYPWSPLAKSVYQLANNLGKGQGGRRLGWSIEGKATERDPLNQKFVKKAAITGIAITPMPKNGSTFLDVIKGMDVEKAELEYEVESVEEVSNVGKTEYILDLHTPEGRLCIDKNMCIHIIKHSEAVNKALTTVSGAALKRESVEGAPKMLTKAEQNSLVFLNKAIESGLIPNSKIEILKEKLKEKVLKK